MDLPSVNLDAIGKEAGDSTREYNTGIVKEKCNK